MELKKVELNEICGKILLSSELIDDGDSLIIATIDKNNDEKEEMYILDIPGKRSPEFLDKIDDEIDGYDRVLTGIEIFKSVNDPDVFYYVATIDDDIRIFGDSVHELRLQKLILVEDFTDLVGKNISYAYFNENAIDILCKNNYLNINYLYASFSENSCIVSSSSEDGILIDCTVLSVKVTFKKHKNLLTEDNKEVLIYLYDEDPEEWEYTHMSLKLKTTDGDFDIMYFIPDINIEDIKLKLQY